MINWRKPFSSGTFGWILIFSLILIGSFQKASSQEYFQQEVNYTIHVTLNDKLHELNAFQTIEYINNSPDTLHYLFFHLWPNGYSGNHTGLASQLFSLNGKEKLFNDPELKGFIDSLDFKAEGRSVQWNLMPGQPDICRVNLNEPLQAGDTLHITTPFHVKIPLGVTSRLGHIGESYQISQWFPKPAVYDRSGWHQMSYLDQGEFYSEFGSFDVSITLPENYIVGATGNLQNEQEAEKLDELAADTTWKSKTNVSVTDFPRSSEKIKTLRYTQNQIHDFAWFADKRFHVMKGKLELPESGRMVTTWVMYTNQQADLWENALEYVNNAILYFSNLVGDYPYDTYTAVQSALNAGVGMEYPGITVIGLADNAYSLDEVITHEVGHSWFYSALASDERRYPYLDESITSAYTLRNMNEKFPGKTLWEVYFKKEKLAKFLHVDKMPYQRIQEIEWLVQAHRNLEQPINLPATDFSILNYELILYNKAARGFNYLRAYLGDSIFDSVMQAYFQQWKFRHPQPDDLRRSFDAHSGKELTWFFSDFLGTTKRLDYKIVDFENHRVLIKNRGKLASPLVLKGISGDSVYFEKWVDGFEGQQWIAVPEGNYREIKIDPGHLMPELFRLNNNIRTSGSCRKADPIQMQLLFTIEDPEKRSVMYIPTVNWTGESGLMAGVMLQNGLLVSKPLEYLVMPFYTFNNPGLAGFGRITYNIIPYENFIRMASINLEGTQFGAPGNQNYHNVKAGMDLYFRPGKMNDPLWHKVYGYYIEASDLNQILLQEKAKMRSWMVLGYQLEKTRTINPFNLLALLESNKTYQKASLELNYRYSYYGKDNGLDIRIFTGVMLKNKPAVPFYAFAASGRSGREQYLFQGTYPDRFSVFPNTFWSRQMTLSEGGLVSPVNDSLGYSRWLISASFTSNLPGKAGRIQIKPFVNILLNDHGFDTSHTSPFFFEAGLKAGIWNLFEIHVPLLVSGNIQSVNRSFKEKIRIVFNLDSFYQMKLKAGTSN